MNSTLKIIADNKIPFLKGVLEPYASITYLAGAETDAVQVKDADALITRTRTKCKQNILNGSKVKMIATATIGFDHIDTHYCEHNNIAWTNAPGCNSGSVKQYIASVLATLSIEKNIQLQPKTIGIIGVGNVGTKVKDVAQALGMNVLLCDPPRAEKEGDSDFVSLHTIIQESDIITFHVPLQREGKHTTFHLGNKQLFSSCKKDVIIINSSRGEVIDNTDLLDALNTQQIGDAILDVWEEEPHINLNLLTKTFMATPHIAGYSVDGKANGTAMSVQAISKQFDLPLKQWYPASLPSPQNPIIKIDGNLKSVEDILVSAILHTYKIQEDDERLRSSPATFEQQRGAYPVRREFEAFTVQLKNGSQSAKVSLNKLGFQHVELI